MPRLAGVLGKPVTDPGFIGRMTSCLLREPGELAASYANADVGLTVGWVGNSTSPAFHPPVWNERRDACLILLGDYFTDLPPGHAPDDNIIQRRILEAVVNEGTNAFRALNGWFFGLYIDLRHKSVSLFSDRYGLGRIYCHETTDQLYFASEAKALLRVLPELRSLDPVGLAETFACGCTLQNRTLFRGVSLLSGGTVRELSSTGQITSHAYFEAKEWEAQPSLEHDEFYSQVRETWSRILPKYLRAPARTGMSLTGGLDGRLVLAWAKAAPGALPCYTFDSPYRSCSDARIAGRIAEIAGQPHQSLVVGPELFRDFPQLAESSILLSDGTMDVTGAVELHVNKMAGNIAPFRVTGNYGSEILRGFVAFSGRPDRSEMLDPELERSVAAACATYQAARAMHPLSFIAFKQVPWHHFSRFSIERSQLMVRSPFLDNDLVGLMYRAPGNGVLSAQQMLRLVSDGNSAMAKVPTDRGLVLDEGRFVGPLRRFLTDLTVKAEYAYDYGMPQSLARLDGTLSPLHLERLFLGRHKFYHFRMWYRENLAQYLKDVLLDDRSLARQHYKKGALERIVLAHVNGSANWTREITRALSLELVLRKLIESD